VKGFVQDATIDHCYIHGTIGAGIIVLGNESNHFPGIGPTNINICYGIFTCSNANGAIRIYDDSTSKDPKDVKMYGNLVYNSTASAGFYIDADLGNTNSIRVYNNTFYNAPVYINGVNATFPVLEFKNNVVFYSGGTPLTDAKGQITAHSNNLFYRSAGTLVNSKGNNYSAANLLSGYESSAVAADPLLKAPGNLPTGFVGTAGVNLAPNTDGLSLQPSSPGIDHGVALNASFAGSITSVLRPVGGGWDMGAYESGTNTIQRPQPPTNLRVVGH
jgi:hypothetical protein